MSDSDKPAIMCHDAYGLTLFKSFVNPADGTGEYPWMKAEKTVLLAPFQIYLLIHKVSISLLFPFHRSVSPWTIPDPSDFPATRHGKSIAVGQPGSEMSDCSTLHVFLVPGRNRLSFRRHYNQFVITSMFQFMQPFIEIDTRPRIR